MDEHQACQIRFILLMQKKKVRVCDIRADVCWLLAVVDDGNKEKKSDSERALTLCALGPHTHCGRQQCCRSTHTRRRPPYTHSSSCCYGRRML